MSATIDHVLATPGRVTRGMARMALGAVPANAAPSPAPPASAKKAKTPVGAAAAAPPARRKPAQAAAPAPEPSAVADSEAPFAAPDADGEGEVDQPTPPPPSPEDSRLIMDREISRLLSDTPGGASLFNASEDGETGQADEGEQWAEEGAEAEEKHYGEVVPESPPAGRRAILAVGCGEGVRRMHLRFGEDGAPCLTPNSKATVELGGGVVLSGVPAPAGTHIRFDDSDDEGEA